MQSEYRWHSDLDISAGSQSISETLIRIQQHTVNGNAGNGRKWGSNMSSIQTPVEKDAESESNKQLAVHVTRVGIIVNALLAVMKLTAGILAHSSAMISDAVNSISDVFSTFIVMIGVRISHRQRDEEHQFGHERMECVAAIVLSIILSATGITIGLSGIDKIRSGFTDNALQPPGALALVAAVITIIVKEWMYGFTGSAAKKTNSAALFASAWDHRSDALSSTGSFIGILGARLGYPVMDPIASVVICFFILKSAVDIFRKATDQMVDKSCDEGTIREMRHVIQKVKGVEHIDILRTRLFGNKIYAEVEITVKGSMTLLSAHNIAEEVHAEMEKNFPDVKHCMVHVNPDSDDR